MNIVFHAFLDNFKLQNPTLSQIRDTGIEDTNKGEPLIKHHKQHVKQEYIQQS